MNILLLDDDSDCLDNLAEALAMNDYPCEKHSRPDDAIESFRTTHYDVVITDIKMPRITGLEFLSKLKQRHPDIHVIVITGYPTVENSVEALNLGAIAYFPKPIKLESLLEILGKLKESIAASRRKERTFSQFMDGFSKLKNEFDRLLELSSKLT